MVYNSYAAFDVLVSKSVTRVMGESVPQSSSVSITKFINIMG